MGWAGKVLAVWSRQEGLAAGCRERYPDAAFCCFEFRHDLPPGMYTTLGGLAYEGQRRLGQGPALRDWLLLRLREVPDPWAL